MCFLGAAEPQYKTVLQEQQTVSYHIILCALLCCADPVKTIAATQTSTRYHALGNLAKRREHRLGEVRKKDSTQKSSTQASRLKERRAEHQRVKTRNKEFPSEIGTQTWATPHDHTSDPRLLSCCPPAARCLSSFPGVKRARVCSGMCSELRLIRCSSQFSFAAIPCSNTCCCNRLHYLHPHGTTMQRGKRK